MALKVAVQMDPLEKINIDGDTTFLMMLTAQARGHSLFVYTPDRLVLLSPMIVVAAGWIAARPMFMQAIAGITGKVTKVVDDNEVEVEIAEGVKVRALRAYVAEVRVKGEPVKTDAAAS